MADQLTCPHNNKNRSKGWDHGYRQYLCQDCDAVIDAPDTEGTERELLYAINRHLRALHEDIEATLPIGLELHMKTLQIIRLTNYRNAAYDEDGNWR